MPRDGSGVYSKPFPDVVDGTTIESAVYNGFVNDVAQDLNTPRPVVAGGTGGSNAATGLFNIGGEKATQLVTDYGSHLWVPGSFRSAVAATGAPNATAAFSGVCYIGEALADPPTNNNVTVEARDATSGLLYVRRKVAGVWTAWTSDDVAVKRNYILNGAMQVSQEWGSTGVSGVALAYPTDQFAVLTLGTSGVYGASQVALTTPSGSPNRLRLGLSTADAAVAAGDLVMIYQPLEGLRVADLRPGTAGAKTITLQFGVKAPAGTYCVAIRNAAANRSYVAEYVITAGEANTDVVKSITITLDTTGTWPLNNNLCMTVQWCLMCGTTYQTTAGAWTGGNFSGSSNQYNFVGNLSNVFELFDVSITEGSLAPPFVVPDYASELLLCKRYFYNGVPALKGLVASATNVNRLSCNHSVAMRGAPTLAIPANLPVSDGAAASVINNVIANYSTAIVAEFDGGGATGLTANKLGYIYQSGSGNLTVNARL